MCNRTWVMVLATVLGVIALPMARTSSLTAAQPGADGGKKTPTTKQTPVDEVFGLTKIHHIHLELSAREWERMQPPAGMPSFFGGFGRGPAGPGAPGATPQPAPKPDEDPVETHKGGSFAMEFPWAHATLTTAGATHTDIGLRYKGGGSYLASMGKLKRNLKVDLDHYDPDQRFRGLKTINLNAGAADPTRLRETLAFAVYREAGVPAPRTGFAEVTLTVPDKFDIELLGLYTVIEQVDKAFLKNHFGNSKGLLMKPEIRPGVFPPQSVFGYVGDDWEPYEAALGLKNDPSKKEAQRVIEFARLIHKTGDEQFQNEIGSYLDVDEFLRFLAVTAFLSNMDSIFTGGHNAYIYLNPETNKFVFIPWDLDLSFAGFPMMGSSEQQMELSLTHPYAGDNKLVDRLLAVEDVSSRYQELLKELAATCFVKEKLLKNIEAVEAATKQLIAKEKQAADARKEGAGGFGFGPPGGMFGQTPELRTFVAKRAESVTAQLAGTTKGYLPVMGFGFGGPAGPGGPGGQGGRPGGPGGFGPGNFLSKPLLDAIDSDKDGKLTLEESTLGARKFFQVCDKDKQGELNEQALADGLTRILPPPPGFGPPGAGPGAAPSTASGSGRRDGVAPEGAGAPGNQAQRPGGGFGPGMFFAPPIIRRTDADKNGKVTLDEFIAAATALFDECDKDKSGLLDDKEIAEGFGLLFPPPPGFGPPPPGPPGARPAQPNNDAKKP